MVEPGEAFGVMSNLHNQVEVVIKFITVAVLVVVVVNAEQSCY